MVHTRKRKYDISESRKAKKVCRKSLNSNSGSCNKRKFECFGTTNLNPNCSTKSNSIKKTRQLNISTRSLKKYCDETEKFSTKSEGKFDAYNHLFDDSGFSSDISFSNVREDNVFNKGINGSDSKSDINKVSKYPSQPGKSSKEIKCLNLARSKTNNVTISIDSNIKLKELKVVVVKIKENTNIFHQAMSNSDQIETALDSRLNSIKVDKKLSLPETSSKGKKCTKISPRSKNVKESETNLVKMTRQQTASSRSFSKNKKLKNEKFPTEIKDNYQCSENSFNNSNFSTAVSLNNSKVENNMCSTEILTNGGTKCSGTSFNFKQSTPSEPLFDCYTVKDVKRVSKIKKITNTINNQAFPKLNEIKGTKSDFKLEILKLENKLPIPEISDKEIPSLCTDSVISKKTNESESSESEWEEVEEHNEQSLEEYKPNVLQEGVEITITHNDKQKERMKKKHQYEMECVRLNINKIRRNNQLSVHKVHLLCLLSYGFHVNRILNSPILKAVALSLIPNDLIAKTSGKKIEKFDVSGIEKIVSWYCDAFTFDSEKDLFLNIFLSMFQNFRNRKALNVSEYNLMFIIIARTLGFKARFCFSLCPITFKTKNLLQKPNGKRGRRGTLTVKLEEPLEVTVTKPHAKPSTAQKTPPAEKASSLLNEQNKKPKFAKESTRTRLRKSVKKNYKISDDESDDSFKDDDFVMSSEDDSDAERNCRSKIIVSNESKNKSFGITANRKKNMLPQKKKNINRSISKGKITNISDDEDFNELELNVRQRKRKSRKALPSNPDLSLECYKSNKIICWAEIYSKFNKKWICIDCVNKIVNKPFDVEFSAHQPVSYILAYDNDSFVKDVTSRYCREFMTNTRKLRVVPEWWQETLKPYLPPNSKLNKEEDESMDKMLIEKPIPQTIMALKDHPLYALKRHLLKFEAIYPPDAAPAGFLRGEPIYPRDCVCKLQSREKWYKNARVVRPGEEPYKMSTQLKWDKVNRVILRDVPLELFGFWQTDKYQPPVAKNGKVPRNEYGNVELFRPDMLPIGTVHIQVPGINRVARKLDIDCCNAVVGFDTNKGGIHPVFDGFIICEEFKDELLAAWEEDQIDAKKRAKEKREKRVYGNWKKLIRGLLITERLKLKYHLN